MSGVGGSAECEQAARGSVRIEAVGGTPDTAVADIGGLYAGKAWSAEPIDGRFTYRYTAVGDRRVTLRRSQISGHIRGAIPPGDDLVVQWITSGRGVPDVVQDRVPLERNVPMLFPTDREFVFDYADYDQRLVHLSRDLVREVAVEQDPDGDLERLRFDHLRRPSSRALAQWQNALGLLSRELRVGGVDSLLWHELTRGVAASFLRLYPPMSTPLPPAVLRPRAGRVRAAVEYIHGHAHEPLTITEIAAAAGLSVRGVQEGFHRTLGVTPMQYVQRVRLDGVHRSLLVLAPDETTVQAEARRWGFAHMGRFSAHYRSRFGEYPKDTLRR